MKAGNQHHIAGSQSASEGAIGDPVEEKLQISCLGLECAVLEQSGHLPLIFVARMNNSSFLLVFLARVFAQVIPWCLSTNGWAN